MTLSRREKIMIIVGLIVIALVAYAFYFLIPYMNNTNDTTRRLAESQSQLSLMKAKISMTDQLKSEIQKLNGQLSEKGDSVPKGIDHAKILMYLKKITDGKTKELSVNLSGDATVSGNLLLQPGTLDFRTDYKHFLEILDELKKNELYSQVTFLRTEYSPIAQNVTAAPSATGSPSKVDTTPTTTQQGPIDPYTLTVHIEMTFYAAQPAQGEAETLPKTPSNGDRSQDLFPAN